MNLFSDGVLPVLQVIEVVFSDSLCERCYRTKQILDEVGADYALVELDLCENGWFLGQELQRRTGIPTLPIVYIRGTLVGGAADMYTYKYTGKLIKMIETHHKSRDRERFFLPNCSTAPKPPRCYEIPGKTKFSIPKGMPFHYNLHYNSIPKRLNKMLRQ
ncbi:glutaredoxin-2, mitochondrial-like isoform X2 [Cimex lectularius]|uniref:Glutaredoxin domain-containing protein n=1 Tax=Cimex lectularius TaxID=79782 RepID=A0A8I6RZQ7_CIMLE|nr:glutaredoxin-2, mitochondrial-like isoform X2 [Cimex lectularius]